MKKMRHRTYIIAEICTLLIIFCGCAEISAGSNTAESVAPDLMEQEGAVALDLSGVVSFDICRLQTDSVTWMSDDPDEAAAMTACFSDVVLLPVEEETGECIGSFDLALDCGGQRLSFALRETEDGIFLRDANANNPAGLLPAVTYELAVGTIDMEGLKALYDAYFERM